MPQTYAPVESAEARASSGKRAPGRPHSQDSRKAILRSTLKLLQEMGFPDLSIEAIAADADVGKATVYRWWPNKASLVAEAFSRSADEELRFPNTGSVRNDVSIQMKHLVRILRGRRGRIVAALIGGGQSDPELIQAFRDRFMMPRRQEAYQTLRRGMARRELPEHVGRFRIETNKKGPFRFHSERPFRGFLGVSRKTYRLLGAAGVTFCAAVFSCTLVMSCTSTRRFWARPLAVRLDAASLSLPNPAT